MSLDYKFEKKCNEARKDYRTTDNRKCSTCNINIRKTTGYKKIIRTIDEAETVAKVFKKAANIGDVLCNKCRRNLYRDDINDDKDNVGVVASTCGRQNSSKSSLITAASTSASYRPTEPTTLVAASTLDKEKLSRLPSPVIAGTSIGSESKSFSGLSSLTNSSQSSSQDPSFVMVLPEPEEDAKLSVELIELPLQRVISSHKYCFICGSTKNITSVPTDARVQAFVKRRIYIPKGNRCCRSHMIKKRFYEDDIQALRIYSHMSTLDPTELSQLMEKMAIDSGSSIITSVSNFSLSEERLKIFTGLTWENVMHLRDLMLSMRNSSCREVIQAIVVFLFKLRTGNSNKLIASILGLEREQQVSDFSKAVLNSFEKDILPSYFGFNALSREDLILGHTPPTAAKLYDSNEALMLIFDGSYIRHQKSTNNEYQRKSYSGHKKVPLCKPFTICTTDGYVVEMLGPFLANQNDAEIMKIVMEDPNGLKNFMKPGDICIVDRGFRDVKNYLESRSFRVLMPSLKGNRAQLTSSEANESRFVTKLRWVVEAVHGIIKQKYRFLDQKVDNKMIPKIGSYYRIACFLNNTYGKRLNSDVSMSDDITALMQSQKNTENTLAIEAETSRWSRRKVPFQNLTSSDLLDFPEMSERDLKILFTGSYQLSQAVSYLAEMMDERNNINLQYLKESNDILKVLVRSRHIARRTYKCFIHYSPNTIGYTGIRRYACDCANGRRTVGCCSHVAATIYYLSHARYLSKILRPAEMLSRIFSEEGTTAVINDDSDED